MGALLFDRPKLAVYWFVAFISLVITGGVLQEQFQLSGDLPKTVVLFFFVLNLTGVGFMIFLLVSYFVRKKDTFQQKSENLLLNIMPKDIVPILKNRKGTVADHYKDASILFADLVDFTPLASQLNPKELVKLLNRIFSHFDTLVDKHDLEKIKTIGDCYMVAAGVPKRRPDHAEALVQVALDMLEYIEHEMVLNRHLHLRLGISSGEVVAGVIGNRKFAYDMWGDAVNLASRMESQGKVGRIQITKETYDLVKHHFNCESGGMINVKGKGEMEVWLVKP
jgi:guanylate cyclase